MTPDELATHYVECVHGRANGWGQYVHPTSHLRSDTIMRRLYTAVGSGRANQMIDAAFKAWNEKQKAKQQTVASD